LFSEYGLERHEVTTLNSGSYATRMELTLSTKEEAGVLFNDGRTETASHKTGEKF